MSEHQPDPWVDTRSPREPGSPCWLDLTTHDIEGAKAFYGELFDWDFHDTGAEYGHYHLVTRGAATVAGLMAAMNPDGTVPDLSEMPTAWSVYLATKNAAATAEAVVAAGGTVLFDPMEVPSLGTISVAIDPAGSAVGFWEAGPFVGFDLPLEAGTPVWFEDMSIGYAAAQGFYRDVFGWDITPMPGSDEDGSTGSGFRYATNGGEDEATAGLCDASGMLPEGTPGFWRAYIRVLDCDVAATRVTELGGTVLDGPADSPFGRVATIADPAGGTLQIIDTTTVSEG